jgi:hypothetical protein
MVQAQDSLSSRRQTRRIEMLHQAGYLEAGWIHAGDDRWQLQRGPRYFSDSILASQWPVVPAINKQKPMRLDKLDALCHEQLQLALANGYPFARIETRHRPYLSGFCITEIKSDKGPLLTWDTLLFSGKPPFEAEWLARALGMRSGTPFFQPDPAWLRNRLRLAGPVQWRGEPDVLFTASQAYLLLPVTLRKANEAMLLAGLSNPEGGLWQLSGEARLHLENIGQKGKGLHAEWRSFSGSSQELQLAGLWAYPMGLPLRPEGHFSIFRLDSTLNSVQAGIRADWPWSNRLRIGAGFAFQDHSQQFTDTAWVRRTRSLPENLGSSVSMYSLRLALGGFNEPLQPQRGAELQVEAALGFRSLKREARIDAMEWAGLPGIYDSLELAGALKSNPLQIKLNGAAALPAGGRWVWYNRVQAQWFDDQRSGTAQAERLGGYRNLRGFREQSIFATSYLMLNSELRLLTGDFTHVGLLFNGAITQLKSVSGVQERLLGAAGISAAIETGAGLLRMVWATGTERGVPFSINASQLHVGLSNRF